MSNTDHRKQSLYFPEEMLGEIQKQAERQAVKRERVLRGDASPSEDFVRERVFCKGSGHASDRSASGGGRAIHTDGLPCNPTGARQESEDAHENSEL